MGMTRLIKRAWLKKPQSWLNPQIRLKKKIWLCALVPAVIAGLCALPPVRDEARWRLAELRNTHRAYSAYIEKAAAKSRHRSKAYHRDIEIMEGREPHPRIPARLFWWWMVSNGSPEDCLEYLETYPTGPLQAKALDRLDRICWAEATKANTVASYDGYNDHLEGLAHEAEAERRVRELQNDDHPFAAAAKAGTEEAWCEFLVNFRGHRRSAEALARLADAEPNNLFRLARENTLDVSGESDSIDRFGVTLTKHHAGRLSACGRPPHGYQPDFDNWRPIPP